AEDRGRGLGEVAVLGHVCRVARTRVVEHPRLPRQRRVLADELQTALRLVHQILVAELEVAAPGVPAESARGENLRPPPRRELRDRARQRPRLARETLRQLEERERGVASVADEVHPARVRKTPP